MEIQANIVSGFFDSIEGDRRNSAEDFGELISGLISDGIFPNYLDEFKITPGSIPNTLIIGAGKGWFNNTYSVLNSPIILGCDPKPAAGYRYDMVVLDVNGNASVRANEIKYLKGRNYSTNQQTASIYGPILINEGRHHQYPLAQIIRVYDNEYIIADYIKNLVGTETCPYAMSKISNYAALYAFGYDEDKRALHLGMSKDYWIDY